MRATTGGLAMKIGLVVERFDPFRGGLEQWTYRLIEKLADRGHEIHVVSREFSDKALAAPLIAHQVPPRSLAGGIRRPRPKRRCGRSPWM